jgi:murein DD-endopeptidase MepM/ murein hydrolase activator NlpD
MAIITTMLLPHFPILILALAWPQGTSADDPVHIAAKRHPTGAYSFSISNSLPCPVQVSFDFTRLLNAIPDEQLPLEFVLPPNTQDLRILVLTPDGGKPVFRHTARWWLGDPRTAKHDDAYLYIFPFDPTVPSRLSQGYNGSFSHVGEYALDFLLEPGTQVCAAREGVVVAIKSDFESGGPDPSLRSMANYVKIYHRDGTFADYVHLLPGGVLVAVGEEVHAGDVIGLSGNTGYSTRPHLHFAVHRPTMFGSETIPTLFYGENGKAVRAVEGALYRSVRPPRRR